MIAYGNAKTLAVICAALGVAVMVGRFSRSDTCPRSDHHVQDSLPSGPLPDASYVPAFIESENETTKITRSTIIGRCCITLRTRMTLRGTTNDMINHSPCNLDTPFQQQAIYGKCSSDGSTLCTSKGGGECVIKYTPIFVFCKLNKPHHYRYAAISIPSFCYCSKTSE